LFTRGCIFFCRPTVQLTCSQTRVLDGSFQMHFAPPMHWRDIGSSDVLTISQRSRLLPLKSVTLFWFLCDIYIIEFIVLVVRKISSQYTFPCCWWFPYSVHAPAPKNEIMIPFCCKMCQQYVAPPNRFLACVSHFLIPASRMVQVIDLYLILESPSSIFLETFLVLIKSDRVTIISIPPWLLSSWDQLGINQSRWNTLKYHN
jgi:hypothetical protein